MFKFKTFSFIPRPNGVKKPTFYRCFVENRQYLREIKRLVQSLILIFSSSYQIKTFNRTHYSLHLFGCSRHISTDGIMSDL